MTRAAATFTAIALAAFACNPIDAVSINGTPARQLLDEAQGKKKPPGPAVLDPKRARYITSLAPSHGTSAGGQTIWIHGNGFLLEQQPIRVRFGETYAPTATVVSDTVIQAMSPPGPLAKVDLRIEWRGARTQVLPSAFTFE